MNAVELAVLKEIHQGGPGHAMSLNMRLRDKNSPFASFGLKHTLKDLQDVGYLISWPVMLKSPSSEVAQEVVYYGLTDQGLKILETIAKGAA